MKIRVVLKQYINKNKKAILAEIKIFTLMERLRKAQSGSELLKVLDQVNALTGVPLMLAYKVNENLGEILMIHNGNCIEQWIGQLPSKVQKINFAADMLRDVILALKTLHELGYSHGDLKPENVCARKRQQGDFRYTLIDFGLCQKLP